MLLEVISEILLDYFRQYKDLYNAEMDKPVDERIMPRWSPPKPTVHECIMELMHVMYDIGTRFTSEEFKTNVENTFVNTGTLPTAAGTFKQFSFKPSGGTTSIAPTGTHLKYSKCASDLDIAESQVNDYICEDIIESWIFDESLDDFDPDIFDNDTLQLEE